MKKKKKKKRKKERELEERMIKKIPLGGRGGEDIKGGEGVGRTARLRMA